MVVRVEGQRPSADGIKFAPSLSASLDSIGTVQYHKPGATLVGRLLATRH